MHLFRGHSPMHVLGHYGKENAAAIFELFLECMPEYPLDKPDNEGNTGTPALRSGVALLPSLWWSWLWPVLWFFSPVLLLAYMKGNANLCRAIVRAGARLGVTNNQGINIFNYQVATKQLLFRLLGNLSYILINWCVKVDSTLSHHPTLSQTEQHRLSLHKVYPNNPELFTGIFWWFEHLIPLSKHHKSSHPANIWPLQCLWQTRIKLWFIFWYLDMLSKEPPWCDGSNCYECAAKFGVTTRKHHWWVAWLYSSQRSSWVSLIIPVFNGQLQPPLWAPAVPQVLYKGDTHHQVWLEQASEGVWHLLRRADSGRGVLVRQQTG